MVSTQVPSIGQGRRVTVVGAGFSGLASAFYLSRAGFQVEVVEQSDKPGGLIDTVELQQGRVETAANGMLNSAYVEELFEAVGVPIAGTKKEARKRFIFREGGPRRWPLGLRASLSLIGFVVRAIVFRKAVAPRSGETVSSWGARVMGEEASRYTVETALQGIYAGDADRMSASVIFGRFFERAPKKPNTDRPRPKIRGTVSAPEGMGQLLRAMRSYLEARGVSFDFGDVFAFDSATEPSDQPVVVATSCLEAARLLEKVDSERAQSLAKIETLPVVSATVFFREPCPTAQGFGCLIPPVENRRMLGVLMNTFIYGGRSFEGYSETWIMGGATGLKRLPRLFEMTDREILGVIQDEREVCFGSRGEVLGFRITRWPQALPHYTVELERALPAIRNDRKNIFLVGNYLGQIGLAKILERASQLPQEVVAKGQWA